MSIWDELKKLLYKPVKQDSRNLEKLGQMWNIPWLEQEANRNVDNPGRAVGKAAASAATWWLGNYGGDYGLGAAGSTAGNAAGTAASAASNAFPAALSSMPVSEIAKLATQSPELAQGLLQGVQTAAPQVTKSSLDMGLLGGMKSGMGGLLDGMKTIPARMGEGFNTLLDGSVPAGMPGTMESALVDTGYTPSSLEMAFQNTGDTTPLSQNLLNYGKQGLRKGMAAYSKGSGNKFVDDMAVKMGMGMMSPQQPQQAPSAPPPQQQQLEPLQMPYTNSMQGPPPGMTWEEWMKRKQMMMGRM